MTVTIDDPKLDEQLVELSGTLGKSVDAFVHDALREEVKRLRPDAPKRQIDWVAIREIQDRVVNSPVLRQGTADELIGYNEDGTFD